MHYSHDEKHRADRWRVKVEESRRRMTHMEEETLKERRKNGTVYLGSLVAVPEVSALLSVI